MIKSLTYVHPTAFDKHFTALRKLFDSLGFAAGAGWDEPKSRGVGFRSPVGDLEIFQGTGVTTTGLLVEVSNLDDVYRLVSKSKLGKVGNIEATSWNARLFRFTVEDLLVTFWQFDRPRPLPFQTSEGELFLKGARFGIVVSRFNSFITERLLHSAIDALRRTGTQERDIEVVFVPGSFEVPVAARMLALSRRSRVDAVICLGLLLRGETSNYEHIAGEVARGIGQAAQDSGKPCTYGVLTCDTLEQAIDRAGLKLGNKGFEAAISAVEMVSLARKHPRKKRK
jgi:6,7-dimethyl-8-ribityllumazine synthase